MNALELVAEVEGIVGDPSFDEDKLLSRLNQGQVAVASRVLLPGLSDGYNTVDTVTDGYTVALPADYQRQLYHAQVGGYPIRIYNNFKLLSAAFEGRIGVNSGTLLAVTVHGKKLMYQYVPAAATTVELFYYRIPTKMTLKDTSLPDGLEGPAAENEHLDWALIHYAAASVFDKIEDAMEGPKANTKHHQGRYEEKIAELQSDFRQGIPHPDPPVCEWEY